MRRELGTADAAAIGLGSMLGAGVFAVFAPAAAAAGGWLLVALGLAGFVAYCNATASARLAAVYPTSGGTYSYGREVLGPWWGFAAGWGFVTGKTASCAAMAMTFAAYAAPGHERPAAVAAVVLLTAVTTAGVTRTATVTKVLLVVVLGVLLTTVAAALPRAHGPSDWALSGPWGLLEAAGLLFFAFAGYARIATLGEEVKAPARTIPRAVGLALAGAVVVYALVGTALLLVLGPQALAASTAPLADLAGAAGLPPVLARVGAVAACLGALLGLLAGVGRTSLAMARHRDLPALLARDDSPRTAQLVVGAVVCGLVLVADLREVVGFSSFGVLLYYAIANACAYRKKPSPLYLAGGAGCLVLVAALPGWSVAVGAAVLAVGLLGRAGARRLTRS